MKTINEDKILSTKGDNFPIHITYFQAAGGKDTPVIVLLHGDKGNRQVWRNGFAERLFDQGYAVVTVDLRKHGQSVDPAAQAGPLSADDWKAMVEKDMEAVKDFIFEEHKAQRLNMNKLAIVGSEEGAAVALMFAANDWLKAPYDDAATLASKTPRGQDVRGLVLLSPSVPPGLQTGPATNSLRQIINAGLMKNTPDPELAVLFCYGLQDKQDGGTTRRLYTPIKAGDKTKDNTRVYLETYTQKFRGNDLIGANNSVTKCEELLLGFFDKHLKSVNRAWVDRRSRFDRT